MLIITFQMELVNHKFQNKRWKKTKERGHLQIVTDWIIGAYVEGDPYKTCGPFLDA